MTNNNALCLVVLLCVRVVVFSLRGRSPVSSRPRFGFIELIPTYNCFDSCIASSESLQITTTSPDEESYLFSCSLLRSLLLSLPSEAGLGGVQYYLCDASLYFSNNRTDKYIHNRRQHLVDSSSPEICHHLWRRVLRVNIHRTM